MRILLLREEDNFNDTYKLEFNSNGFNDVTSIPVLTFQYFNLDFFINFSNRISEYSGLIFTSKRGIDAFKMAVDDSVIQMISETVNFHVYVVGTSSESHLRDVGLSSIGSHTGNAKELSDLIIQRHTNMECQKPLLFVCGNLARKTIAESLNKHKISLDTITCYKTIPDNCFLNNFKQYCNINEPSVIVFFSPSGAEFFLQEIKNTSKDFDNNIKVVAIGQTTANAIEKLHQTVHGVAKKPSPFDLVDIVKSVMK